jgi:tRNA threonylcarbamoyladenosine biosynthesis protein TsaE
MILRNQEELAELAIAMSRLLSADRPKFFALRGEMGAGKTFFARRMIETHGFDFLGSPSFAIMNIYDDGHWKFLHMDAWRLPKEADLSALCLEDYGDHHLLLEWADLLPQLVPAAAIDIEICRCHCDGSSGARRVSICAGR